MTDDIKTASIADLKPGDVLLSLGDSKTSQAIGALDGGRYSHAAIWTGEGIIESTLPRVVEHLLPVSLKEHPRLYVDAFRHAGIAGNESKVVKQARCFVGRTYAHGDLVLGALLLATSTWIPSKQWQIKFIMDACGFNFLEQEDLSPKEGELVTCTELAVRAYQQAGIPIQIRPSPPAALDVSKMMEALFELWRARGTSRGLVPDAPYSEDDWAQFQAGARAWFAEATGEEPVQLVARAAGGKQGLGGPPLYEAGENWRANLTTPRHLQTSPNLRLLGRIHEARAAQ